MKNILIITYWSYKDALIQTYTLPYVKVIRENLSDDQKIYLVTLEQDSLRMNNNDWQAEKKKLLKYNIHLIRFNYTGFGSFILLKFPFIFLSLVGLLLTKKISHIHSWCTPAGAIGYLLSVITGKKLILDSYEPHAEPMVESGTWKRNSLKFKLLFWLEKKQLQRAIQVITCVDSMKNYVKNKFNFDLTNSFSKPACIDFDLFDINRSKDQHLVEKYQLQNKTIGIYAGKFEGSYLKDEVFEFIKIAENYWGKDNFRFIILTNHPKSFVHEMISKHQLNSETIIQLFVPHHEIPSYLRIADFGISPFIPVPSKRYGSPIKNGEYWAMGLPVVITKNISDDSDIIEKESAGYVLQSLTIQEYRNACEKIEHLINDTNNIEKIKKIAFRYRNFEIAKKVYHSIYHAARSSDILILTYWSYKDALIQTYTLPYIRIIQKKINKTNKIFLFTLEQDFYKMNKVELENEKANLLKENIHLISMNYSHFGLKMILKFGILLFSLYKLVKVKNISTIHAWCTPAGSIGYILSKFTNTSLIIDSYEPHAESMVENGTWNKSSFKFKLLFWFEKKQSQKAKVIIALTNTMKDYAKLKYNVVFDKYFVKPALVNFNKFNWNKNHYFEYRKVQNLQDQVVCVYAGKLGGIYLEEEVFDFIKIACEFWGDKFKFYLLTDVNKKHIDTLIQNKNINAGCVETLFVDHNKIQEYYQLADFAINPVKPVLSKRYCTSIKDGEYWAMGLPIVITRDISDDSNIIATEDIGYVLQNLSPQEYLNACKKIDALIKLDKTTLNNKIVSIAKKYRSYEIAESIYEDIYS